MFRNHIRKKLAKFVKQYFLAHPEIKMVVVDGSIGKTSTKIAIAELLTVKYRVRMALDNDNSDVGVMMTALGIPLPEDMGSYMAWWGVFKKAKLLIKNPADVDVILQELDSDYVDEVSHFSNYITPDVAVITAVTPEHMDKFGTLENVAREELSAANFSKSAIINRDDIDGAKFGAFLTNPNISTYGNNNEANYSYSIQDFDIEAGYSGYFTGMGGQIEAKVRVVGDHNLRPVIAAVAVASKLGLSSSEIQTGLERIHSLPGRMNVLKGMKNSIVIDDSYDSSPATTSKALATLYSITAPTRIAVFGDMSGLGEFSEEEHKKVGLLCDPNLLAWVITVGEESEKYLAPAARSRGCQVKSFKFSPDAGGFAHKVLEDGAVVLFNGSDDMYMEEAVKVVLHASEEDVQLVRQTPNWVEKKQQALSGVTMDDKELDRE